MFPSVILTKNNIASVAKRTTYSEFELVNLLIRYNARGHYPVRIPQINTGPFGLRSYSAEELR